MTAQWMDTERGIESSVNCHLQTLATTIGSRPPTSAHRTRLGEDARWRHDPPYALGQAADLLNAAFRRDFHNAAEYRNFTQRAPSFRCDLDLVMVAPDRTFAAYVGIPYDDANRRGIFEPVCTHPAHQRRGLAKTLMLEGLHRLCALGAVDVTVDTGAMIAANALYSSLGFTEAYKGFYWRKLF